MATWSEGHLRITGDRTHSASEVYMTERDEQGSYAQVSPVLRSC